MSDRKPDSESTRPDKFRAAKEAFQNWRITLGKRRYTHVADQALQSRPISEVGEVEKPREQITNIAGIFKEKLNLLGESVIPPAVDTTKVFGVAAAVGTNEAVGSGFFEAVQAKNPDGYLVGVGAGNVFTMLHCFQEGVTPKGIVLADIDPRVVLLGKMIVKKLQDSHSVDDFNNSFFYSSPEMLIDEAKKLIQAEEDPVLKERLTAVPDDRWKPILSLRGDVENADNGFTWKDDIRTYAHEGYPIDAVGAFREKFDTLKQLADNNSIAVSYADFTNPDFVIAVASLAEFKTSTNIIYLSNIVDHVTNRGTDLGNLAKMSTLRGYEPGTFTFSPQPVFIDTLGQRLNYFLRARRKIPEYEPSDFNYLGDQRGSRKPEGLLFADEAAI